MCRTRKNQRKALKALALGVATAAIFTTTASAQIRSEAASKGSSEISSLSWGASSADLGLFNESVASRSSVAGIPDGDNYVANLARSAPGGGPRRHRRERSRQRRERRRHPGEPGAGVSPDRAGRRAARRLPAADPGRPGRSPRADGVGELERRRPRRPRPRLRPRADPRHGLRDRARDDPRPPAHRHGALVRRKGSEGKPARFGGPLCFARV